MHLPTRGPRPLPPALRVVRAARRALRAAEQRGLGGAHTHTYINVCIYVYICIYIYICIYVYTYVYELPSNVDWEARAARSHRLRVHIQPWQPNNDDNDNNNNDDNDNNKHDDNNNDNDDNNNNDNNANNET